jgi:hypothetical protein
MQITDGDDGGASQGFVQVHGPAADDEKSVLYALIGEKLNDVLREFHRFL